MLRQNNFFKKYLIATIIFSGLVLIFPFFQIKSVSAANALTCSLSSFVVKDGDPVTISAVVNFDASAVWAIVEDKNGTLKYDNLALISTDDINYSAEFNADSTYEGKNNVAVYATVNAGETLLCNPSDGVSWVKKSVNNIDWSGRYRQKVINFNNKMYLLGGFDSEYTSEVWSSTDGETWKLINPSATWGPRRVDFGAIVFNNKMWVMGGYRYNDKWTSITFLNDVWSSTDGNIWTQEKDVAAWPGRSFFGLTVYNSRMWLSGGCTGVNGSLGCNASGKDVWSSTNGKDWDPVTDNAAFGLRGYHAMYTFSDVDGVNKMWVLGGAYISGETITYKNDLYSSIDGQTWGLESSSALWTSPRIGFSVELFNPGSGNKVFALAGGDTSGVYHNDVWSTSDGVNWVKTKEEEANPAVGVQPAKWTHWTKRRLLGTTVFNNKLWVLGGQDKITGRADVWSSSNGNDYNLVNTADDAPYGHRFDTQVIGYNSKLWVMGGFYKTSEDLTTITNDIWSSVDGITWICEVGTYTSEIQGIDCTHKPSDFGSYPVARWGHRLLVHISKLYLLGGCTDTAGGYTNCPSGNRLHDVWEWDDNTGTWLQQTNTTLPGYYQADAASFGNKIYWLGDQAVYYSADNGVTWIAAPTPPYTLRVGHRVLSYNGKLWLMGGWSGSTRLNDVWSTADPITGTWSPVTAAADWRGRYTFGAVVYNNQMWVMGGNASGVSWADYLGTNEVWHSADGLNWDLSTNVAEWPGRDFFNATVFANRIWLTGGDSNASTDSTLWASRYSDMTFFEVQSTSGQVTVTAEVPNTLSVNLSSNTCAFGTFDPLKVKTCAYSVRVSTNASSGYIAYIKTNANLASASHSMNNTSNGKVEAQIEAYGVATTKAGQTITQINDANNDSLFNENDCTYLNNQSSVYMTAWPLSESEQSFASANSSVSEDVTFLCHGVAISGTTPAGTYQQISLVTVINNF